MYPRSFSLVLLLILHFVLTSKGQDKQFSQFYQNVTYLNPAFAGSAHGLRGILHQRVQWPSLEAKYITSFASLDHQIEKTNSGVGVYFLKDWQGGNNITTSELSLQFAQEVRVSSQYFLRVGAQGTYGIRDLDYSRLTFPDQYNSDGFRDVKSNEHIPMDRLNYMDVSLGGMVYGNHFWAGFSGHHLNRPDQTFYNQATKSYLPSKWAAIAGYKILFRRIRSNSTLDQKYKEVFITPTMHYKLQGKSDQFDFGIYGLYHQLIGGVWYRGIPVLKYYREGIQNNESLVLLAGYKIGFLSITYSYDFTVSKLATTKTGGSHEANITYVQHFVKRPKIRKKLPCPDF